jgi:hypothetical protein
MARPIIFISYSRSDIEFVRRLARDLEQAGYVPWWDVADLRGGQAWAAEIEKHVRECSAMIVVLSPEANRSEWVHKETLKAAELRKQIIPVMWRESEVPITLVDRHFVDFRRNYADGLGSLLQALSSPSAHTTPGAGYAAEGSVPAPKSKPKLRPGQIAAVVLSVTGALLMGAAMLFDISMDTVCPIFIALWVLALIVGRPWRTRR